jgi:hypothetical protein
MECLRRLRIVQVDLWTKIVDEILERLARDLNKILHSED